MLAAAPRASAATGDPGQFVKTDPRPTRTKAAGRSPLSAEYALIRKAQAGDRKAEAELLQSHQGLIAKIAREACPLEQYFEDYFQEGAIGFLEGLRRFDCSFGVKLLTYASWFVWQRIRRSRQQNGACRPHLPTNLFDSAMRLRYGGKKEQRKFLDEAVSILDQEKYVALDAPLCPDGSTVAEVIGAPDPEVDHDSARVRRAIDRWLTTLSDRDRIVAVNRWLVDEPLTLSQVGRRIGVSRERVRQLQEHLLPSLREHLAAFAE